MAGFQELGVMDELVKALESLDWILPTEIQAEAIPLILGGGDILMASETGSGKTGAFCIPIVQVVYESLLEAKKESKSQESPLTAKDSHWNLSPVDRAPDVVLSTDLSTAQSKSGNWQGCRTNKGIKIQDGQTGRLYYEAYFAEQGLARLGWSKAGASLDLGTDPFGWGYGGTAKKSNSKQFTDYGQPFGEKFDIVGCILDMKDCQLSFTKNGRDMGVAFKIQRNQLRGQSLFPSICVKNAGCRVRFARPSEKNDYKPNDCIWVSDVSDDIITTNCLSSKIGRSGPLALIIEPSRELAIQTYECLQTFSKELGVKNSLLIGGTGGGEELDDKTHIIVGTPGRISEEMNKGRISFSNVHFFILDEADALLKQGFQTTIRSLHSRLPKMFNTGRRLQTICCSATLHNFEVKNLSQQLMYFPAWIDLKGEDSVPDTVHHVVLRVNPRVDFNPDMVGLSETDGVHKDDNVDNALSNGLKLNRPEELSEAVKVLKFYYALKAIEKLKMDRGILFCRTKLDCDNLNDFMNWAGEQTNTNMFSSVRLHSSLSQLERREYLESFKKERVRFLICTDVAARGIDIKAIPYVIQVTLPDEKTNYIHRIGRVGRADRMGLAISLVSCVPEKVWYHTCKNSNRCSNTRLTNKGGCCEWLDELSMLAEIEDHLKCSIQEIGKEFELQVDEYDGKVVYGSKRLEHTLTYQGHVEQLKSFVNKLSDLELKVQSNYFRLYM